MSLLRAVLLGVPLLLLLLAVGVVLLRGRVAEAGGLDAPYPGDAPGPSSGPDEAVPIPAPGPESEPEAPVAPGSD